MNRVEREYGPNWNAKCENCGSTPVVRCSGLCGPCHFGTAEAVGGGWWDEATKDFDADFLDEHVDSRPSGASHGKGER